MKKILFGVAAIVALVLAVLGSRSSPAQDKQDKYTLQCRAGLRSLRSRDTNNGT